MERAEGVPTDGVLVVGRPFRVQQGNAITQCSFLSSEPVSWVGMTPQGPGGQRPERRLRGLGYGRVGCDGDQGRGGDPGGGVHAH